MASILKTEVFGDSFAKDLAWRLQQENNTRRHTINYSQVDNLKREERVITSRVFTLLNGLQKDECLMIIISCSRDKFITQSYSQSKFFTVGQNDTALINYYKLCYNVNYLSEESKAFIKFEKTLVECCLKELLNKINGSKRGKQCRVLYVVPPVIDFVQGFRNETNNSKVHKLDKVSYHNLPDYKTIVDGLFNDAVNYENLLYRIKAACKYVENDFYNFTVVSAHDKFKLALECSELHLTNALNWVLGAINLYYWDLTKINGLNMSERLGVDLIKEIKEEYRFVEDVLNLRDYNIVWNKNINVEFRVMPKAIVEDKEFKINLKVENISVASCSNINFKGQELYVKLPSIGNNSLFSELETELNIIEGNLDIIGVNSELLKGIKIVENPFKLSNLRIKDENNILLNEINIEVMQVDLKYIKNRIEWVNELIFPFYSIVQQTLWDQIVLPSESIFFNITKVMVHDNCILIPELEIINKEVVDIIARLEIDLDKDEINFEKYCKLVCLYVRWLTYIVAFSKNKHIEEYVNKLNNESIVELTLSNYFNDQQLFI